MKLQYLIIVFIIIAIPMIVLLTYYMSLQKQTLDMQTAYDLKLISSVKQAIEAFEVNTVEWDRGYSRYADTKRKDILASINTFTTSFANNLNMSGINRESILTYVPAVMYNLYDGFYIYTPTNVPVTKNNNKGIQLFRNRNYTNVATTDMITIGGTSGEKLPNNLLYDAESGGRTYNYYEGDQTVEITNATENINNAKKEYKHILKTFVPYSEKVKKGADDYIINYTLDNYIRVYWKTRPGEQGYKEGYLIDTTKITGINTTRIKYDEKSIEAEVLLENVAYLDDHNNIRIGYYQYVYNMYNEKCYFDETLSKWFKVKDNKRIDLENCKYGDYGCEYKVMRLIDNRGNLLTLYQLINRAEDIGIHSSLDECPITIELIERIKNGEYIDVATFLNYAREKNITYPDMVLNNSLKKDFSAFNYYIESYFFSTWVDSLNITDSSGNEYLKINNSNKIEDKNSPFNRHKAGIMQGIITDNLKTAIASYSKNSSMNFELPIFTEEDWDKIFSNISMTAFVQNIPIGLKYYNNYVIAVSSNNKEYVNPDEIYYISENDKYFHLKNCGKIGTEGRITGYKNIDFIAQSIQKPNLEGEPQEDPVYYFKHAISDSVANKRCYYCLISKKGWEMNVFINNPYNVPELQAIARERYVQQKKLF